MSLHNPFPLSGGKLPTTLMLGTALPSPSCLIPCPPGLSTNEPSVTSGIDAILDARQARYGGFRNNSEVAQKLKSVLTTHPAWESLDPWHQEALHQILSKVSRLIFNPNYLDNWVDIAGYATLVVKELE
jgi:hypothetical protein